MIISEGYSEKEKEIVLNQINSFNDKRYGSKSNFADEYRYVAAEEGKDKSEFISFILTANEKIYEKVKDARNVIDLCFGSGNLSSNIILNNNLSFTNLYLNDIDSARVNTELKDVIDSIDDTGLTHILHKDFFNASDFENLEKSQIVIINPLITNNDSYEGRINLESINILLNDIGVDTKEKFENFLNDKGISSDIAIEVSESEKTIRITSNVLSKREMENRYSHLKIFNYYDVFYQSKDTKEVGIKTNIVRLRQTIDTVSDKENSVVIFVGEESHFESLFKEYNYILKYQTKFNKPIFIATKSSENLYEIYSRDNEEFTLNEMIHNKNEKVKINLEELNKEIKDEVKSISEMLGIKFKSGDKSLNSLDKTKFNLELKGELPNSIILPKNILLKGVPGTGKSKIFNDIINEILKIAPGKVVDESGFIIEQVLRINVHSATSNSDLMQGIGIYTKDGVIGYREKMGLIMQHILRSIMYPLTPFVLILEEIQENSLNQLIGDLIYLIEEDKRTRVQLLNIDSSIKTVFEHIDYLISQNENVNYVNIPFLIENQTMFRKMIFPNNLYVFCTSNYREDKKIIEDNLLRRFEVIDIYPTYKKEIFKNENVANFLEKFNMAVLETFKDTETHPDRLIIGHAIWLNVLSAQDFTRAFIKLVIEFKDIKEIEYADFQRIFENYQEDYLVEQFNTEINKNMIINDKNSYYEILMELQKKCNYTFIK